MTLSIVFFLVVSSGSIFGASVLKRKYEEVLPLSVFAIILIQFVFGLAGMLRFGAYFVFALAVTLYIVSLISVFKTKSYHAFFFRLLTPGFAVTVVLYLIINFANYGKLASSWDDFSHWADVVKAMVSIDGLATNAASMSAFASYVPAMPLFQYNMQVLGQTLHSEFFFSEWHLYVSYQFASYASLTYFMKDLSWRKPGIILAYGTIAFFLPSVFSDFFNALSIDAYLGVLAGCSLSYLTKMKSDNPLEHILIFLSLACLVLTKDAGILFSILIGLLYVLRVVFEQPKSRPGKRALWQTFFLLLSILLPKLMWNTHLSRNDVAISFGGSINLGTLIDTFLRKDGTFYRWLTLLNYSRALSEYRIQIGDTSIGVGYLLLSFILISGVFAILSIDKRTIDLTWNKSTKMGIAFFSGAYLIGLCIMYMFKFSEYEAVRLASLPRYMGIFFTMLYTVNCVLYAELTEKGRHLRYVALGMLILMIPTLPAQQFISRQDVRAATSIRSPYLEVSLEVQNYIPERKARVYVISQESTGFDYWVLRYSLRPLATNGNFTWSIGTPFYEGDVWTLSTSSVQWMNDLVNEYEYVLLYKINDYFIEEFFFCFEHPELIEEKTLFKVDKERRLLVDVRDSITSE